MTFDQLWQTICDKNPTVLCGDTVTLTVRSFHKAIKLAYDQGRRQERLIAHDRPGPGDKAGLDALRSIMGMGE